MRVLQELNISEQIQKLVKISLWFTYQIRLVNGSGKISDKGGCVVFSFLVSGQKQVVKCGHNHKTLSPR